RHESEDDNPISDNTATSGTMGDRRDPEDNIPAPEDAHPIKIYEFKTSTLTRTNVRTWKSDVREFCQMQGYWKVVEQTLKLLESADKLKKLLGNPKWASQDATARIYVKINISEEDKTSVR